MGVSNRQSRRKPNRPVWLSILAVLVLGIWSGQAILASTLMQTVQVSGEVRLQGRQDYSGVEVQVRRQSGDDELESFALLPAQVTDFEGGFSFTAQGALVITARQPGYLDAQARVTVTSDELLELGSTTLYGGDVTGDNLIDIGDLAYMGASFNSADLKSDINSDGQVDILDLTMAAANFLMRGPTPWGE